MKTTTPDNILVRMVPAAALAAFLGLAASGETLVWDPEGSGGWGSDTRWQGGGLPDTGDTVSFSGCTGLVTAADAAYLSKISEVQFASGAGLVFSNDASEAALSCGAKFTGDGVLLKRGSGDVSLTYVESRVEEAFFMTGGIEIYGGRLIMPRNNTKECSIRRLAVYDPGIFVQAGGSEVSNVKGGIYGDGTISNNVSKTFRVFGVSTNEPIPVFSGKFVHNAYFVTRGTEGGKVQYLTGMGGSTSGNGLLLYGQDYTLGASSFGTVAHAAPWGTGTVQWRGPRSRLLYLGTGETSNKAFFFGNGGSEAILDAGEHGGLYLTGLWSTSTTENNRMNAVEFTGCGTNEFGGAYRTTTNKTGRYIGHYVVKSGDGTWRFTASNDRQMRSVFETRRGELQFASIAEKGEMCSLGDASLLHSRYIGDINDSRAVPYAYLLGDGKTGPDDAHLATMNYVGGKEASVSTRPIAIHGAGRLKSDGEFLSWGGITAVSSGVHTAVLGGEVARLHAFSVTNGPGRLSVAKDGSGSWTVGGDYDFTGDVTVRQGGLRLAGTDYEWYRLTIMQTWAGITNAAGEAIDGDGGVFSLKQWALMDKDGENQFKGEIAHNFDADGRPWLLNPGECAMGTTNYQNLGTNSGWPERYDITNLFVNALTFSAQNKSVYGGVIGLDGEVSYTQGWVRAAVRLPKGHNPVVRYDLMATGYWPQGGSSATRIPRSWMVEGSVDGVQWDVLDMVISNDIANITTGAGGHWFSNNSPTLGMGFGPYPSEVSAGRPESVASVEADAGATLESGGTLVANGVTYDCAAGGGTISGFGFAENAAVRLVNCDESAIQGKRAFFALDLSGCTGLSDTSKWTFSVNGRNVSRRRLRVSPDGITVVPRGGVLSFR